MRAEGRALALQLPPQRDPLGEGGSTKPWRAAELGCGEEALGTDRSALDRIGCTHDGMGLGIRWEGKGLCGVRWELLAFPALAQSS